VIEQLRAEESKLLNKIEERATVLQRQDPRLSRAGAIGRATAELPRTYAAYSALRERLIQARLLPTLIR